MKNINRIFLFGDSWIEGQGTYNEIDEHDTYQPLREPSLPYGDGPGTIREWRRNNSWNKFFIEKYGLNPNQIINYGTQGSSNYEQYYFLNSVLKNIKPTDLILFGFTSKFRDGKAIRMAYNHQDFPMSKDAPPFCESITHEKNQLLMDLDEADIFARFKHGDVGGMSDSEIKFSKEWILDYMTTVFDESVYENIAQANFLFYQKWCKENGVNIFFFDLFESYIDQKYLKKYYEVDESIYINYGKKNYFQQLVDFERENYTKDSNYTIWEHGGAYKFPCGSDGYGGKVGETIYHPNQIGYKLMFDDITNNHVDINFKINVDTN